MIEVVAFGVVAVAVVVVGELVAESTGIPAAVLLVLAGLVYGLLPGPNVRLDPEVVLLLVLPPLLYWAALNAGLLEIRANLRPVGSLAVTLVLVTAVAVGAGLAAVLPGVPFAAAVALGAAVAPPDPVAALAIGRRAGLPPRLLTLIEGEGLLNDATAITTFEVAVAVAAGGSFSLAGAAGRFLYSAAVGTAVGWGIAWVSRQIRRHLHDPLAENALSLATPFLAYLPAEELHASGLLAVVVTGLWVGHEAPRLLSGASRLQTRAVWRLVNFLLEGVVFLLIGNQLPTVIEGLNVYPIGTILSATGVSVALVLLVRPAWLWLTSHLPGRLLGERVAISLSGRELVAMSWAGTRGVISLAAAFALPLDAAGNYRALLIFCTYAVVLVTLVGQGLTFAPLLRALHLQAGRGDELRARGEARSAAVSAGLRRLEDLAAEQPVPGEVLERLRALAEGRRQRSELDAAGENGDDASPVALVASLRRQMIEAEREELLRWRDAGRLPETGLRALEHELDYEERFLAL